jgi:hypothetical protein
VQALRELNAVAGVPDLELAAAAAMVQAHEAAKVVDADAVMSLQTKLEVRLCMGGVAEKQATCHTALHS